MLAVNAILNRVNEWSEPDCTQMVRVVGARLATLGCVVVEVSAIGIVSLQVLKRLCSNAINTGKKVYRMISLWKNANGKESVKVIPVPHTESLVRKLLNICKLIIGLASTILVGIIFSPKGNFEFHMTLGLAVDQLTARRQKAIEDKQNLDLMKITVENAREKRFFEFQAARQAERETLEKAQSIDPHLAEKLMIV